MTTMQSLHWHIVEAHRLVGSNKIWGGQGWHHNPLSVVHKLEAERHLQKAIEQMLQLKDDIRALEELAGISHGG